MKALYCLLYTFVFMGVGVMVTLISQYLDGLGFSGEQIGVITAAGTFTVVCASPFWGHEYAVMKNKYNRYLLVAGVLLCAAITAIVMANVKVFIGVLLLYILLNIFHAPSITLMDSITIDDGQTFGQIRTFGALGFAFACPVVAILAQKIDRNMIFPAYAGCFFAAMIVILLIRRKKRTSASLQSEEEDNPENVPSLDRSMTIIEIASKLITNRRYLLFLLSAFFICGTGNANNTYYSFLHIDGGGTLIGVGIAFFLMAGSEAPFMAVTDKLCDRFGQGRILLIAMLVSVLRFGLFALGPSWKVLIALFPLQGVVNGITLVEFVKYSAKVVPEELHGVGISVYYALGSYLSTIICQMVGGYLLDHQLFSLSGAQSVYLFFAVLNVIGVIIFISAKLHRE